MRQDKQAPIVPSVATGSQASEPRREGRPKGKKGPRSGRPPKFVREQEKLRETELATSDSWGDEVELEELEQRKTTAREKWLNTRKPKQVKETDPKPTTAPKDKKGKSVPTFNPGQFPIVFDALGADADTDQFPLSVNWAAAAEVTDSVLEALEDTKAYETYRAHRTMTGGDFDSINAEVIASGVLTGVQNLVQTHISNVKPVDGCQFVMRPDLPHIRSVRTVMNQIGTTDNQNNGVWYQFPDLKLQVRRGLRLSRTIAMDHAYSANREKYAAIDWLPVDPGTAREDLKVFLRSRVRQFLKQRNYPHIMPEERFDILTGQQPAWFNYLAAADQADIQDLFVASPNTPAGWLAWVNGLTAAWLQDSETPTPALGAGTWAQADFGFGIDVDDWFINYSGKWSREAVNLNDFFHLTTKTACSKVGSAEQTSTVTTRMGMAVLEAWTTGSTQEQSLFAAFPLPQWCEHDVRPRHKRLTCVKLLSETRTIWASADVKR